MPHYLDQHFEEEEDPSELPRNSLFFLEEEPEPRGTILSKNMPMMNADYMRMGTVVS